MVSPMRRSRSLVAPARRTFTDRIREIDMFFQQKDPVHQAMRRTASRLKKANIPYAIVGGMAINAHKHQRTTADVDFLLNQEGFAEFLRRHVEKDYQRVPGRARRFIERTSGVSIDILVTGLFPGSGKPGPVAFPDPREVSEIIDKHSVVNLPTLIVLKLAARRYRDFGDVVELIRANDLGEAFLDKLHPSVRQDFIECLEERRREDEYERRESEPLP